MTITPTGFSGAATAGATLTAYSGSLTSNSGDVILVTYGFYNSGGGSVSQTGTPVTSTPSKTFTKVTDLVGAGSIGIGVYAWTSDGTTLTAISVAPTASGGGSITGVNAGVVKIASDAGTCTYDATTRGAGTDTSSPLAWTAGAAITGTQIGITAVVIDNGASGTFTQSAGYSNIYNNGDGSTVMTGMHGYKNSESGTPSLSVSYSAAITDANELFISFKEPTSGNATAPPSVVATPCGVPTPSQIRGDSHWVSEVGSNTNNAGTTTITITAAAAVPAGDTLIIAVASDNSGTAGAARTISTADNSTQPGTANSYPAATQVNRTPTGTANDGTTFSIIPIKLTRALAANDVITLTFSAATNAKAVTCQQFRNTQATISASANQVGAATNPTATSGTLPNAGCLVVGFVAVEGGTADSFTQDSDTTNGSWVTITRRGVGTTTSGQTINGAYKIATATGAQTYNPTLGTSRDYALYIAAFDIIIDATLYPSAVATPCAVPTPDVPLLVATTQVATPCGIPSPTITTAAAGNATATPSAVATPCGVPSPTITANATATPSQVATPCGVPTPVVVTQTVAAPSVVATVVAVPAPTVTAGVTKTPSVVATPCAVPTPTFFSWVTGVSTSGRYLVDQNGLPIFVQGNSPQNMAGQYTPTQVHDFFADQATRGINSAQVHAMVDDGIGANAGAVNYNGDPPWTSMSTLSGTSAATDRYWANVDNIFNEAQSVGCTIWFSAIDNISHGDIAASLSDAQAVAYGTFLGARYKDRPGLVWVFGNDWQPAQWSANQAKYLKILEGIRAGGDTHLVTVWLNYTDSISTDIVDVGGYTAWSAEIAIEYAYSYTLPYYQIERAYTRSAGSGNPRPVIGAEWNYTGEHNHSEFGQGSTTNLTIRRSNWWTVTWGGCGNFFGQSGVWGGTLDLGSTNLNQAAAQQNTLVSSILTSYDGWQDLIPDTGHSFVTAGYGTHDTSESVDPLDNNFVSSARTADGMLAIVYLSNWSSSGTATIDVAGKISGTATITRIDPTNGATTTDSAPYTTPGNNAAGDPDWILVFQGTPVVNAIPSVVATPCGVPSPVVIASVTVAPSVVATPSGVPSPVVIASATIASSVVATPIVVLTPTITASATAATSVVSTPVAIPSPTITASAEVQTTPVATPVVIPAPTIATGTSQTSTPSVVPTPVAVPSPGITASAIPTPSAVPTPVAIPAPAVQVGGSATAAPSQVATPVAIPAPTITLGTTTTPSVVPTPVAVPSPSASAGASASTSVVPTPVAIPAPTISAGSSIFATPSAVPTPIAIPSPAISASGNATPAPNVVPTPVAIPAPSIIASATTTPSAVPTPVAIPAPIIAAHVSAPSGPVATPVAVPSPSVAAAGNAAPGPSAVPTPVGIPSVVIATSTFPTTSPVATPCGVPTGSVFAGTVAFPVTVNTPVILGAPVILAGATAAPSVVNTPVGIPTPRHVGTPFQVVVFSATLGTRRVDSRRYTKVASQERGSIRQDARRYTREP